MVDKANCTLISLRAMGPSDQGWFLSLLLLENLHPKYKFEFGLIRSRGMWGERFKQMVKGLGYVTYWDRWGQLGLCHLVKKTQRRWSNINPSYWKSSCKEKHSIFFSLWALEMVPGLILGGSAWISGKPFLSGGCCSPEQVSQRRCWSPFLDISGWIQTKPWLTWSAGGAGPASSRRLD